MSDQYFDEQLRRKILEEFDDDKGRQIASTYEQTQSRLREIYENIRGSEPSLSDHGSTHILNVKNNVMRLLSDNNGVLEDLSGIEMYCLGMFILFHDAGNVYGRKNHHEQVGRIFDRVRGEYQSLRREKTLIVRATRAHTGKAQDGSYDTLKELSEIDHLEGRPVRLRELAAILRFADELAEGPQRTSEFMQNEGLYAPESKKFHDYANSTHIFIQRSNNRIVLTYEIIIDINKSDQDRSRYLSDFLKFVYSRIIKLNQERQYARYYSKMLQPFILTEIKFNFHCGNDVLEIDLAPLRLTDIVVPGEPAKQISEINASYSIETLVETLLEECPMRSDP